MKSLKSSGWRLVSVYPGLIGAFLISEPPSEKFAIRYTKKLSQNLLRGTSGKSRIASSPLRERIEVRVKFLPVGF